MMVSCEGKLSILGKQMCGNRFTSECDAFQGVTRDHAERKLTMVQKLLGQQCG